MREASLPAEIYPFADDLIFSLFDTKSVVAETYIQDPISSIKLFPIKSNSFTPTSTSCCVLLNSSILPENNYEISFIFKYSGLTGTFLQCYDPISGKLLKINKDIYFKVYGWTTNVNNYTFGYNQNLTDDEYYRFVITFGNVGSPITFKIYDMDGSIKISNANNDNNLVAKPVNNTTLSFGAASVNGVYSDAYQNQIFDLKISTKIPNSTIFRLPLAEGYDDRVFDVINSTEYTINDYTDTCWNNKQDILHYNFYYGFTLYDTAGDLARIPNTLTGSEIIPSDIADKLFNYQGVKFSKKWNGCESLVKLEAANIIVDEIYLSDIDRCWFAADGTPKEVNLNRGLSTSGDFLLGVNEGRWFIDDHNTYSQFRLCAYRTSKLNNDAIDIHKFVGNETKLLTDGNLEYIFDVNGNPLWIPYR